MTKRPAQSWAALRKRSPRALFVQRSVVIEHHGICRVHERHVQKLRHHARGEVLSPADDELLCIATGLRTLAKQAELLADGI